MRNFVPDFILATIHDLFQMRHVGPIVKILRIPEFTVGSTGSDRIHPWNRIIELLNSRGRGLVFCLLENIDFAY